MPRPQINLARKIKDILAHVENLPAEADSPLSHYQRSSTDIWNLLQYVERNFAQLRLYPAVMRQHLSRMNGMILVNLTETFERFLKEVAGACVDCLAQCSLDDRFDAFKIQGSALAAHFGTATLGKSLCESVTWLSCKDINDRFRNLLADPFKDGNFQLFPKQPKLDEERYETLSIVWQLRHTMVHNVGVITQSDAIKLRLLAREQVAAPRVLCPTRDDLRYLKRFLDETADLCNNRIGNRLAELLSIIHGGNPALFDPQQAADRLTQVFGFVLSVAGVAGNLQPP